MGAKFKKTLVSENVRKSLHGWQKRVKAKQSSSTPNLLALPSTTTLDFSKTDSRHQTNDSPFSSTARSSSRVVDKSASLQHHEASASQAITSGISQDNDMLEVSLGSGTRRYDTYSDEDDFSKTDSRHQTNDSPFSSTARSSSRVVDKSASLQHHEASASQAITSGISQDNDMLEVSLGSGTRRYDTYSDEDDSDVHDHGY